ncbi:MAG: hypothetical protein QNJ42_23050 [Crocosphaera sp.]|nr:hypothetical protein [Crocosphaera sp.]
MLESQLQRILKNPELTVDEKEQQITQFLHSLPGKGVNEIVEFIINTNDGIAANYLANYLSILPNYDQNKRKIVEQAIHQKRHLLSAVVNLVKDLPDGLLDQLINAYFQNPSSSDLYNIIFEVAQFFPEKLHKFDDQIEDEYLRQAILTGGSDRWVDELVRKYYEDQNPQHLQDLAWFRTDKALDALLSLAPTVPEEDLEDVYAYIESSGVFPDTRLASVYFENYRGYVVSREESPHHMGGSFPYPVPKCPFTDTPANRILSLDTSQLDLDLESPHNPTFFWYEGEHPPDCIYVQFTDEGIIGLMTPMTEGEVGTDLIPGELALKLEEYPCKYGRGMAAIPGFANHQVGGYPPLIRFERFPRCPICGQGMQFLVSIDSGMTPFGSLGFTGILYGFWCDPCSVSCTYGQTDE